MHTIKARCPDCVITNEANMTFDHAAFRRGDVTAEELLEPLHASGTRIVYLATGIAEMRGIFAGVWRTKMMYVAPPSLQPPWRGHLSSRTCVLGHRHFCPLPLPPPFCRKRGHTCFVCVSAARYAGRRDGVVMHYGMVWSCMCSQSQGDD